MTAVLLIGLAAPAVSSIAGLPARAIHVVASELASAASVLISVNACDLVELRICDGPRRR